MNLNYLDNYKMYVINPNWYGKTLVDTAFFVFDPSDPECYSGSGTLVKNKKDLHEGALTGGATFSSANNGIIILDGVNGYINWNNYRPTHIVNTTLMWIKIDQIKNCYLLSFGLDMFDSNRNINQFLIFNNVIAIRPTYTSVLGSLSAPSGWVLLSMVRNNLSSVCDVYINKTKVYTQAANLIYPVDYYLRMGKSGATFAKCSYGHVSMYNLALTETQIFDYYDNTKGRFGV